MNTIFNSFSSQLHSFLLHFQHRKYLIDPELSLWHRYRLLERLGEGYSSQVFKVLDTQAEKEDLAIFALKIIDRASMCGDDEKYVDREISILENLAHPHIIRLHSNQRTTSKIYLFTEYCSGGDLFDYLFVRKTLHEQEALGLMKQIISAVSYLHSKHIAHRDIKFENIFIYKSFNQDDNGTNSNSPSPNTKKKMFTNQDSPTSSRRTGPFLKLGDFGFAKKFNNDINIILPRSVAKNRRETFQHRHSTVGTPSYTAPEVQTGHYTKAVDMWSVGVLLYTMLSGSPPYYSQNTNEFQQQVYYSKVHFTGEIWEHVSSEAKELITGLLEKDPQKRITADQCLNLRWFKKKSFMFQSMPVFRNSRKDWDIVVDSEVMARSKSTARERMNRAVEIKREEDDLRNHNFVVEKRRGDSVGEKMKRQTANNGWLSGLSILIGVVLAYTLLLALAYWYFHH
eukprot:TRINITY_DN13615_c0_g1_i1.p1 TRINITY_DN13615_c0_g1~~TRINITY_DN13615_c0_g1_i1.p1  ORF type:complete len:467 (+),score=93.84 TRINITY_DN13615_c0_g1_i1:40-1401(+)